MATVGIVSSHPPAFASYAQPQHAHAHSHMAHSPVAQSRPHHHPPSPPSMPTYTQQYYTVQPSNAVVLPPHHPGQMMHAQSHYAPMSSAGGYPLMIVPVEGGDHYRVPVAATAHPHPHAHAHAHPLPHGLIDDEPRKTRHIKSSHAMRVLKTMFANNPKPTKEEMKGMQAETGCSYSEICRWFRNERHKEKRMKEHWQQGASNGSTTSAKSRDMVMSASTTSLDTPHSPLSSQASSPSLPSSSLRQRSMAAMRQVPNSPHSPLSMPSSPSSTHHELLDTGSSRESVQSTMAMLANASVNRAGTGHTTPGGIQASESSINQWIENFQGFPFDQQQCALAALLQQQHAATGARSSGSQSPKLSKVESR